MKCTRYPTISEIDIVSSVNVDEFNKSTGDIFSYELRNTDILKIVFKESVFEVKKFFGLASQSQIFYLFIL